MMVQAELFPHIPAEVQERVDRAMASNRVSPCARAVLLRLRDVGGRQRAVSIWALQSFWRISQTRIWGDRDVKAAVKELLEEHGVPIGAARSQPAGYFLLVTPEDIDEAERPLIGEIRSLARRLRAVNAKSEISRLLCGQLGIGE